MKRATLWAFLYAVLIIGLSSIPGKSFPDVKWLTHGKLIHMGEYFIFGILVSHAAGYRVMVLGQLFLFTLLIAAAFGALDETYQILIPGRDNSLADWVADVVGVVLGSLLYIGWKYYRDQAPTS
ncbi:MAG: VanZ family protein [Candidatus Neomarinimicrobiota bacterium]